MAEEQDQELGIKETLEAALFGAACGKLAVDIVQKKVSSWGIAGAILPAVGYVEAAVDKIEEVPAELADIDDDEMKQLRQQVKLQLGIKKKEDLDIAVDACLDIARGVGKFVALAKGKS